MFIVIVTNRVEFVMKKTSWAYNLTFTVIGELFAAVLQICGGPQKSIGNAPLVYKCMMSHVLEYDDIFLSATLAINKKRLQTLQNKGLRCALCKEIETSTDELHREANILPLKYRREQHLLNYMYNQAQNQNFLKPKSKCSIQTRSHEKTLLKLKKPYTEKITKKSGI